MIKSKIRTILNSLIPSKKNLSQSVCLSVALLFFANSVFAINPRPQAAAKRQSPAAIQKKPQQLFVRDYKYFREFNYGGAKLLVNKSKTGTRNILLTRGAATLSVVQNQDTAIYEYMIPSQKKRHYLVYKIQKNKKTKVAYYTVDRTKYFNESAMPKAGLDDSGQCSRGPNWSVGDLRDIAKAIGTVDDKKNVFMKDNGFDPANLIDDETCRMEDSDLVRESVEELFENNGGKLIACLQSDAAIKKLESDKSLLANANLFVSRVISFVDVAQDNSEKFKNYNQALNAKTKVRTPIKIKCELDKEDQGKGKTACFNDLAEQPELRLNLSGPPIKVNGAVDKAALQKSIVHELIHASGQQMQIKPTPNCVDELIVKSLEGLCADPSAVLKVEAGVEKCAVDKGMGTALAGKGADSDGGVNDVAFGASIVQSNTINLPSESVVDVKPVANSEVAQLANANLPQSSTLGERISIPDSSPVASSFGTVFDQLSNSMTGMGKVVATAAVAAGTISAAVAQTNSASTTSMQVQPATVIYPLSQVASDKYSSILSTSSSEVTESTRLASTLNSLDAETKLNPSQVSQLTAKTNSNTGTAASAELTNKAATATNSVSGADLSRKIASVSNSVTTQSSGSAQALPRSNENQIVNQLFVVDSLAGNKYSEIKNKYSDPDFLKRLDDLGISIEIRNGTNVKKIGSLKNSKIKFIDDGQKLKKIDQ